MKKGLTYLKKQVTYVSSILIILISGACFGQNANTNQGTNFWFGFTATTDGTNAKYVVYINSFHYASGTISIPGAAWSTPFTVTPNVTTRVVVPSSDVVVTSYGTPVNQGVNVTSDSNIGVFAAIEFSERSDNSCILPVPLLGNQYYVLDYTLGSPGNNFSEFMIVAQTCVDTVQITPSQNITVGGAHSANVPYTVVLQPGQVYALQCAFDLTGSEVQSLNHAETAVFAASKWNSVGCAGTANPLYEEQYPVNTWGENYVFLPTAYAEDQCRVLAEQNNTVVTIYTGSGSYVKTLNAGQYYDTTVNYSSPVYINANNPISVGRIMRTGPCNDYYNQTTNIGDPAQVMVDANEQMSLDSITFYVTRFPTTDIDSTYLQLVTRTVDVHSVYLDNINLSGSFNVLAANPTYSYASLTILPGAHKLITTGQGFVAYWCGLGNADAEACDAGVALKEINIATASTSPSTCTSSDGTATANATGIPPFSYKWSNGQTTQTATGLSVGIYTVTVSDSDCVPHTDFAVVNIAGPNGFTATVTDSNPTCTHTTGSATANPSAGSSPYTYLWNDPSAQTTATATGLTAGSYTCIVTDNTGCKYFATTTITAYIVPAIGIAPYNDTVCGVVSQHMHVYGLNTNVYNWVPAASGLSCYTCSDPIATPSVTTTYTISGLDSNGCSASSTALIYVHTTPKPIITGKDSICAGYTDTLIASGATTYKWNGGATTDTIFRTPFSTVTYTLIGFNGASCTSHDTTMVVHVLSPAANINPPTPSVCPGDSVQLSAVGGTTYLWNTGQTSTSIWVKPVTATTYTLHAYEATCSDSTTTQVTINTRITGTISATPDTVCTSYSVVLTATPVGGPAVSYKWSTGALTPSTTVNPTGSVTYSVTIYGACDSVQLSKAVTVNPIPVNTLAPFNTICHGDSATLVATGGGTYKWSNGSTNSSITVAPSGNASYSVVVTDNGCSDTATSSVIVDVPLLSACCDDSIQLGDTAHLEATGAAAYVWSPATGLSCSNCSSPIASPTVTTTYTVTSTDASGCSAERIITIIVKNECADFNVPNVLTPNNDGINDDFVVNVLHSSSYSITIYDRWGKQVFSSSNPADYWNGRINGTDNLAPDGTYYYSIKTTCGINEYNKKGFVEVMGEK